MPAALGRRDVEEEALCWHGKGKVMGRRHRLLRREEQGRFCGGSFTPPPWMCKKHKEYREPIQTVFSEIIAAANCQIIIIKHLEVC